MTPITACPLLRLLAWEPYALGRSSMIYVYIALAGLLVAMQAGSNATLDKSLHNPVVSSLISFGSGVAVLLCALAIYTIVTKTPMPRGQQFSAVPWWGWIGGTLGAVYVLAMVLTAEKVGSGIFVGLSVTASILASLAIDHFGLLGFHRHAAGPGRILGGAFMVAGMLLIGRF
jgi:bacterial/archaeal transporter family-2 protein